MGGRGEETPEGRRNHPSVVPSVVWGMSAHAGALTACSSRPEEVKPGPAIRNIRELAKDYFYFSILGNFSTSTIVLSRCKAWEFWFLCLLSPSHYSEYKCKGNKWVFANNSYKCVWTSKMARGKMLYSKGLTSKETWVFRDTRRTCVDRQLLLLVGWFDSRRAKRK